MALWPAHLNQQVNHMRIVDDVNFEIQIQIQRLPGELCSGECVGGGGAAAAEAEDEDAEGVAAAAVKYVCVCVLKLSRGFQCQCLPATPSLLPSAFPTLPTRLYSPHFIVFALWLHSKFISMTLRRRRHWSSYIAHQQVNCQGSLEGACDTPYLPPIP